MLFRPISHPNPSLLRRGTAFIREISCQESYIATYVAEVHRFARHSNFGTNLDDCLRDRLVCGLSNTHIIKNCLRRRTSIFPKPFSWLQRWRQPLVMRWSLGRRLSLPRCTSSHLLVDDVRRSLAHLRGLPHLQQRRSASVVVALVIAHKIVSAAIWNAMHAARRDTFLAPVHGRSRMAQRRRVRHMLWRKRRKTTLCSHCTTALLRKRTRLRVPERSRFGYIRR